MSKRKTLINRVVNRAVEEAEIKKEIEDLKRQRDVVAGTLDFYTRYYAGEFKEPDASPDDEEDYSEDYAVDEPEDAGDGWVEWDEVETEDRRYEEED